MYKALNSERQAKFMIYETGIVLLAAVVQLLYMQKLKKDLHAEQKLTEIMLDNSNIMVVLWNPDGEIKYVNEYLESKTGFDAGEMIGKNWLEIYAAEKDLDSIKGDVEGFIKGGGGKDYLQRMLCKDGSSMEIVWNSQIIRSREDQYYIVSMGTDISEIKEASEVIDRLTNYHELTSLPNRNMFMEKVDNALLQMDKQTARAAVLLVDVDNFADMNNAYGYRFGDEVLVNIGEVLNSRFGGRGLLSHYDGDCFALFIPDIRDARNAVQVAKKIIKTFRRPELMDDHEYYSTVSVGISVYPRDGASAEELVRNAESALYYANKKGRSRYQLYKKEIDAEITKRLDTEYNLRRAIENDEFVLHYQPQVDIATGRVISLEALIRWNQPKAGMISPAEFIPVADETGLINPIGEWVLRTACKQVKTLNDMLGSRITLAVNLSPSQFQNPKLSEDIFRTIETAMFDPELLEIEITEEAAIKDIDTTVRILKELGSRKIRIALDDFCTGYSSLCYLEYLPIDKIKIDKSFVDDMLNNHKKEVIVESLIGLAHRLDIDVVAEGVEELLQNEVLRQKQCDMVQGYYFSRPLPFNDLIEYLGRSAAEPVLVQG